MLLKINNIIKSKTNNKMKYRLNKYVLGMLVIILALTSCSKNEDALDSVQINEQNILTFTTVNEFDSVLNKVNELTSDERIAWEKSKGFESYGTLSNKIYESANPEEFKNTNEINSFVELNSNYIQLYTDLKGDTYCVPKEFENSERYLLNSDKMYVIGVTAYKKFDRELVSTNIANIKTLQNANKIEEIKTDQRFLISNSMKKSQIYKVTNIEAHEATNDAKYGTNTYRIKLWIQTEVFHYATPFDWETYRETEFTITNYSRSLGIWWGKTLSTTYSIDMTSWDERSDKYDTIIASATNHDIGSYNKTSKIKMSDGLSNDYPPIFANHNCSASNTKGCRVTL